MRRTHWLLLGLLLLISGGCGQHAGESAKTPRKRTPDPHLVETARVVEQPLSSAYERTGSLKARRIARVYNQEQGRIVKLPWFEGDAVKRGALLLRLDDALLRAELDKAKANSRQAKLDLKRIASLVKRNAASKDELERARTALQVVEAEQRILQTRLGYMRIQAPFDGLVSARLVEPGDVIGEHSHVLTLVDPFSLVIEIRVSELLLPHLAVDDPVQIRIDALGNRQFTGKILRIHPALDPATRQGVVEAVLDPVPQGARAGQFTRVILHTASAPRILIPFAALQRDRAGEFVYRVNDESKVERAAVRSGLRSAEQVEIVDGLEPGQSVIVRGMLGLTVGKKVADVTGS